MFERIYPHFPHHHSGLGIFQQTFRGSKTLGPPQKTYTHTHTSSLSPQNTFIGENPLGQNGEAKTIGRI